jgi:ketosteroid isomerase-like protein
MFRRFCAVSIAAAIACGPAYAASASIEDKIRSEVATEIAGINAQDPVKATAYEADDMMFTECGVPAVFGAQSYREGLAMTFNRESAWRLSLIDEGVAVAPAGNEAIYHSTYDEDSMRSGVPYTHRGKYVAGFRRDPDSVWRIHWSVVCWQSPSHKKDG